MQEHHLVGEAPRLAEIVGDEDNLDALPVRRPDDALDHLHRGGIEADGRFVEEENLRVDREGAGERQTLLFAAGEQPRRLAGTVEEADTVEQRVAAIAAAAAVAVGEAKDEIDVGGDRAA